MVLVILSELPDWLQQDGAKLFFFACVVITLLVVAKWSSRRSESSYSPPASFQSPDPAPVEVPEPIAEDDEDSDWLPSAREVSFTLRWMRFKSFPLEDGPEDPDCFCDELEVELNYKNGIMPWDCMVATPKGLEMKLGKTDWDSYYARQIMVVSRYDPNKIQSAILLQIKSELESYPEEVAEDEMKDAQSG